MPNRHLWTKNVPRVEYDHRARDTRLRLQHLERLLGSEMPQKASGISDCSTCFSTT